MKVTVIGAGAVRIIADLREFLKDGDLAQDSEIVLFDINRHREAQVGRMLLKTPEIRHVNTKITTGLTLEAALEGADYVYFIIRAGTAEQWRRNADICLRHEMFPTDNLSVHGAVIAANTAAVVMDVAAKLEKLAPHAWFITFTNPIAVYTYMLNHYTKTKAVGVCAGCTNYVQDLSMVLEDGPYLPRFGRFDIEAAGINHFSWIMKNSRYDGKDLYAFFDERTRGGLKINRPDGLPWWTWRWMWDRLYEVYRIFGHLIFSSEGDGWGHLFHDEMVRLQKENAVKAQRMAQQRARNPEESFEWYLDKDLPDSFWQVPQGIDPVRLKPGWQSHYHPEQALPVHLIRGLSGHGRAKVVTTFINHGAIDELPDAAPVECSMWVDRNGLEPVRRYNLPSGAAGLTYALAEHQMLVAEALINDSPQLMEQAFYAYPMMKSNRQLHEMMKEFAQVNPSFEKFVRRNGRR